MSPSDEALGVYLNDHMAGATAAVDLVTKMRSDNEGTPLGDFLGRLGEDIEADRASLQGMMDRLGVPKSAVKRAGATVAEKLGRLRFNPRLTGSDAVSRLLELETVSLGVEGKLGLWRALLAVAPSRPQVAAAELEELAARARRQLDELEPHRVAVAREAFGD